MQTGACAAWQKHGSSCCVGFRLPAGYGREATGYVRLGYVTGVFSFISGVSNVGARGLRRLRRLRSLRSSIVSTCINHSHPQSFFLSMVDSSQAVELESKGPRLLAVSPQSQSLRGFEEIALLQKVRHECVAQLVDFVWASKARIKGLSHSTVR